MRICMVGNATAVHLQRWAKAYRDAGHAVSVVSIRSATIPGVDVHTVAVGPVNSANRFWTLLSYLRLATSVRRAVRSCSPDVVNPHFVTTSGVLARIASIHPIVLTAWGSDVIPANGEHVGAVTNTLNRWAIAGTDRVTGASRYLSEWIEHASPGTVVDIVPFGVDTAVFRPRSGRDRTSEHFTIGVVKSLEPRYGIDVAIRAMESVIQAVPDARLIITGGGTEEADLRALVANLDLDAHVTFVGRVPHDDVPDLMDTLDVLVNPTVVPESFGVVILEASAMELPVVATDVGGVPDVCVRSKTGVLVPPRDSDALADAIVRLASDPTLRASLGASGRSFVKERFAWTATVETMLSVLESAEDTR
ncbi:MAG: glycosyltransferase [Actinomycetota bacterium]|nr:glycosyltransferase [Actinomycetota bacterium]